MAPTTPALEQDFKTASHEETAGVSRHTFVAAAFTIGALGDYFDLNNVRIRLTEDGEVKKYVLSLELIEGAEAQDKDHFLETRMTLNECLCVLQHDMGNGLCDPVELNMELHAEEAFSISTPRLADLVALYATLSALYDLKWEDPRTCVENGLDYSLADIRQALALLPEPERALDDGEAAALAYDRPVETGRMPKAWLQ